MASYLSHDLTPGRGAGRDLGGLRPTPGEGTGGSDRLWVGRVLRRRT